jgi:1-acyl-sn-glycerol-3-phosphate acyltransferase
MWLTKLLMAMVRLLVGANPRWLGSRPSEAQRIYFANHSSHIDTVALWSALPPDLRSKTRPVAAADYWQHGRIRRMIAIQGLNVVFVERKNREAGKNPLDPLKEALAQGDSLIIFPEGTRHAQALPEPFKAGLFHLALAFPEVELIPVYLDNLHRSLPKGSFFPVPLLCTVRFGPALSRIDEEDKEDFLVRARQAMVDLA